MRDFCHVLRPCQLCPLFDPGEGEQGQAPPVCQRSEPHHLLADQLPLGHGKCQVMAPQAQGSGCLCLFWLKEPRRMGLSYDQGCQKVPCPGPKLGKDAGHSLATEVGGALHVLHKGPSDPPKNYCSAGLRLAFLGIIWSWRGNIKRSFTLHALLKSQPTLKVDKMEPPLWWSHQINIRFLVKFKLQIKQWIIFSIVYPDSSSNIAFLPKNIYQFLTWNSSFIACSTFLLNLETLILWPYFAFPTRSSLY